MTAAPGRNPEAGDYTIECPGHGIGSRTKSHIASGLRVSRLGFERHQTRVATPNGYGRVCSDETVMAQTLPHRLQELELWMCKRLIHVGAMDERVRRVSNDCADAVRLWCCCDVSRCLGLVYDEIKMRQTCHRPTQQYLRRTFAVSSGTCGYTVCGGISLGVTSSQIRFGFLSKQINRIKGAWRQEQAQDTQDTSKIDFVPEIANSTRCCKSSSTNCSKQGGEHDKPSFAAQFTGSNLEQTRCNRRDKEVTKNKRNEKEDAVAKTIKPSRRVAEVEAEQAAPACGASRNSNAGRILHLPSFLDLDFDLDISDFHLATRPHASLGLRRSSVRTSRTTRYDTCNAYNFFGHPEIGRRPCANRIRCQSGPVDAHKCYQCWANVITTTTTTALVQMT
ncbi:hypothetical protein D6C95_03964 [Aureobasidium pullulans]|nr:hypothetical protein D6C95_03964 [Aureobasidium pullulans]